MKIYMYMRFSIYIHISYISLKYYEENCSHIYYNFFIFIVNLKLYYKMLYHLSITTFGTKLESKQQYITLTIRYNGQ